MDYPKNGCWQVVAGDGRTVFSPAGGRCRAGEPERRTQLTAVQVLAEGAAEDAGPAFGAGQLLRSWAETLEELDKVTERGHDVDSTAVAGRHGEPGLPGMAGLPRHAMPQQRPAGDRLAVLIGIEQAHEQRPPSVDQRDQPGHELAAGQVVGGESGPARAYPVKLEAAERENTLLRELLDRGQEISRGLEQDRDHWRNQATVLLTDRTEKSPQKPSEGRLARAWSILRGKT